jgi:hypothetical protein
MTKRFLIVLVMLLLSSNAYAKSITLKDLINDGKIYEGMSKTQLAKTGGFPSIKKQYAEVFWCSHNTVRDYYPSKRMEILAGGGQAEKKRDVEGNRVFFVFKSVTKPSTGDKSTHTCDSVEDRGNGILAKWFFTLEEAEDFVMGVPNKKNIKLVSQLQIYKDTCEALGFELGTDKFADCTLKLFVADNKETTQIVQSSSGVQEMIIYDPDREHRINMKKWNDNLTGKCRFSDPKCW